MTIVERAVSLVQDGMQLGLGSGRAARAFVAALGDRIVRESLRVVGVPTSKATAEWATQHHVPLIDVPASAALDLAVDGADEIDPNLDAIKGYGRALLREKIVAAMAKRFVVLVGHDKLVPKLGSRGRLPVEIVPCALRFCEKRIRDLGLSPTAWSTAEKLELTDNGNYILDCQLGPIDDAAELERSLREIPGVVGTGLFLNAIDIVLVGDANNFALRDELRRQGRKSSPQDAARDSTK